MASIDVYRQWLSRQFSITGDPLLEGNRAIAFYIDDALAVETEAVSFMAPQNLIIDHVLLAVDVAPDGADLIIDVKKNGTTLFSTAVKPTIVSLAKTGKSGTPDVTSVSAGDKITVDIAQVGSTTAGSNLAVTVVCKLNI